VVPGAGLVDEGMDGDEGGGEVSSRPAYAGVFGGS